MLHHNSNLQLSVCVFSFWYFFYVKNLRILLRDLFHSTSGYNGNTNWQLLQRLFSAVDAHTCVPRCCDRARVWPRSHRNATVFFMPESLNCRWLSFISLSERRLKKDFSIVTGNVVNCKNNPSGTSSSKENDIFSCSRKKTNSVLKLL